MVQKAIEHRIELASNEVVHVRPYEYSEEKHRIADEQIQEMMVNDIIEPTSPLYNFPIAVIKRKDGLPRFCADYCRLNCLLNQRDLGVAVIYS